MKYFSEKLQNLLYFIYKKTRIFFFILYNFTFFSYDQHKLREVEKVKSYEVKNEKNLDYMHIKCSKF